MSVKLRTERELVSEILDKVREIAELRAKPERFVPGSTRIHCAGRVYDGDEMTSLVESALEFWLTAGRWHKRFETRLAEWYGAKAACLVNSGSSANLAAVAALTSHLLGDRRLSPGDEVITVAAGFPTTVAPLIQHGLVPVFIDIDRATSNIDVTRLEQALSRRTRAVMVAHTLGNPFDLDAVAAFCEAHRLWLVEDNCDAAGATYRGRKTGTFGHLATLSFYPAHHMTTGEGGAVLINDEELDRPLQSVRDWGKDCWCRTGVDNTCGQRFSWDLGTLPHGYDHKYIFSHLGYNLKMTDMQAAIGCAQLEKLDSFVARRQENWQFFRGELDRLAGAVQLPEPAAHSVPSWFGFMLVVRENAPFTRDDIVGFLEQKKIQTRMLLAGNMVRQPALIEAASSARARGAEPPFRVVGELTNTDEAMNRGFWFGVYPGLTDEMRGYIAEQVVAFVSSVGGA